MQFLKQRDYDADYEPLLDYPKSQLYLQLHVYWLESTIDTTLRQFIHDI